MANANARMIQPGIPPSLIPFLARQAMLIAASLAIAALLAPAVEWVVPLVGLYAAVLSFYYGAAFSAFIAHTPLPMRGAALALMIVMTNLGGYGLGPQTTGIFSDVMNKAGLPDPLRWALIGVTGFFIVAAVLFRLAMRAIEAQSAGRPIETPAG